MRARRRYYAPPPMPTVSVIVPVYNPGRNIDDCLARCSARRCPREELELIFVDDGSTDGTPARLDALAAEHAHVRVEHIPNSGWPGKPRNIGIDMAHAASTSTSSTTTTGSSPTRSSACTRWRVEDDAEIVIGKVVGHGKRVPRALFAHNRHGQSRSTRPTLLGAAHAAQAVPARLRRAPRPPVPRGPAPARGPRVRGRRLLRRPSASPCSPTGPSTTGSAARRSRTPPTSSSTPPATTATSARCSTSSRPTRSPASGATRCWPTGIAGRCSAASAAAAGAGATSSGARALYEEVRKLALERFDERIHERLAFNLRVRSKLLRAGDYEGLERLARFENRIALAREGARHRARRHAPRAAARVAARQRARPAALGAPRRPHVLGAARPTTCADALTEEQRDVTGLLRRGSVTVWLRNVEDDSEYLLPARTDGASSTRARRPSAAARGSSPACRSRPTAAAAGGPLPPGHVGGPRRRLDRRLLVGRGRRAPRRASRCSSPPTRPGGSCVGAEAPPPPPLQRAGLPPAAGCRSMRAFRRTRATAAAVPPLTAPRSLPDRPPQVADPGAPRRALVAQVAQHGPDARVEHPLRVQHAAALEHVGGHVLRVRR